MKALQPSCFKIISSLDNYNITSHEVWPPVIDACNIGLQVQSPASYVSFFFFCALEIVYICNVASCINFTV